MKLRIHSFLFVLLIIMLAACGSDSPTPTPTAVPPAAPTSEGALATEAAPEVGDPVWDRV